MMRLVLLATFVAFAGCTPAGSPSSAAAPVQDRPIVVVVHADWCAACLRVAPAVAWMREEYSHRVSFIDLDVTDEPAMARATREASRQGLGPFFDASGGQPGISILGKDRVLVRRFAVENRPGPYRAALEQALGTFDRRRD